MGTQIRGVSRIGSKSWETDGVKRLKSLVLVTALAVACTSVAEEIPPDPTTASPTTASAATVAAAPAPTTLR